MSTTAPRDSRLRTLASILVEKEQSTFALLSQKYFRISEAASVLGIHPNTLLKQVHQGLVPGATRTGRGRWRIPASFLQGKGTV
jgi:excisionase family DNA binding protein